MSKEPENVKGFEGPKEGGELLSLLLRFGSMSESSALMQLDVDINTLRVVESVLVKEGWIKPPDTSLPDPVLELSPTYEKKISAVKKSLKKTAKEFKRKEKAKEVKPPKPKTDSVFVSDMMVLVSMALSLYLVWDFIRDPGRESVSLLAAALLFFVAVLVYASRRRSAEEKKKGTGGFVLFSVFNEILARRRKHVVVSVLLFLIVFFVGRFVVNRDPINLLLLILPLSTIPLVLLRRMKISFLLRYYAGMLALMYVILLLSGFYSVSQKIIGRSYWVLDVIAAFVILALLRFSEKQFGVGISFVFDSLKFQKKETPI